DPPARPAGGHRRRPGPRAQRAAGPAALPADRHRRGHGRAVRRLPGLPRGQLQRPGVRRLLRLQRPHRRGDRLRRRPDRRRLPALHRRGR
ncbi:MAG: FIG025307: hypothetical protein, partial [uncultured Friedmanniella sp.]